jgi:hypothetical protein
VPDIVALDGLPLGSANLTAPIETNEIQQSQWATGVIQANIGVLPSSATLTLVENSGNLSGEPLADDTYQYTSPLSRVKNPSFYFHLPITLSVANDAHGPGYNEPYAHPWLMDGVSAKFLARAAPCLSAADHPSKTKAVLDDGGNLIPCKTADGITPADGSNNGNWYDISPDSTTWRSAILTFTNPLDSSCMKCKATTTLAGLKQFAVSRAMSCETLVRPRRVKKSRVVAYRVLALTIAATVAAIETRVQPPAFTITSVNSGLVLGHWGRSPEKISLRREQISCRVSYERAWRETPGCAPCDIACGSNYASERVWSGLRKIFRACMILS